MTTRLLPPEEWARLEGTLTGASWRRLDPEQAQVLVCEDHGTIVASAALFQVWHLEGLWVAPAYRGRVALGRRFLRGLQALLDAHRVTEVLMMATTTTSAKLCRTFGHALALTCEHFAVTKKRDSWA